MRECIALRPVLRLALRSAMPRAFAIGLLLVFLVAGAASAADLKDVHPDEREAIRELGEALAFFSVDGDGHVDALTAAPSTRLTRQLARIASLSQLRSLTLGWSEIADADLAELRKLTQLRRLVMPPGAGDRGIANVANLVLLEELFLTHAELSDEGLKALAKLKQLAYLGLAATKITDAGVPRLLGLHRLREIDLRSTRVGDEGILGLAALREPARAGGGCFAGQCRWSQRAAGETTPTAGRTRGPDRPRSSRGGPCAADGWRPDRTRLRRAGNQGGADADA